MKVFNNPHFTKSVNPSQSVAGSRATQQFSSSTTDFRNTFSAHQLSYFDHTKDGPFEVEKISSAKDESSESLASSRLSMDQDLYDAMKKLKDSVINLLHKYQQSLSEVKDNKEKAKEIRKQIRKDSKKILRSYNHIIETFITPMDLLQTENQIPSRERENEINNMFNLIEEFLEKFQQRKPTLNLFSTLLQDKIEKSGLGIDLIQSFSEDGRQSLYDFGVEHIDTQKDLTLTSSSQLDEQLSRIDEKLQEQIKELSTDEQLAQIVPNLRAIIGCKESDSIKDNLDAIKSIQDSSASEKLSFSRRLAEDKLKELNVNLTFSQNFKIALSQSQKERGQKRRRFFDLALKIKQKLPSDHEGKKILVSILYEEAHDEGIPEVQWEKWIFEQLNNKI